MSGGARPRTLLSLRKCVREAVSLNPVNPNGGSLESATPVDCSKAGRAAAQGRGRAG